MQSNLRRFAEKLARNKYESRSSNSIAKITIIIINVNASHALMASSGSFLYALIHFFFVSNCLVALRTWAVGTQYCSVHRNIYHQ